MLCPKCNHQQRDSKECEKCGVLFAKYRLVQERKKKEAEKKALAAQEKSGGGLKIIQMVVLVVLVASGTYYFVRPKAVEPLTPQTVVPQVAKVQKADPVKQAQKMVQAVKSQQAVRQFTALAGNPVQRAIQATVSIETPWGTGSGFFVNKYYIVTNRHVVEFDESKIVEFKRKVETTRRLVDLEKQKIRDLQQRLRRTPNGPTRNQLVLIIESRINEVNRILPELERGEYKLKELGKNVQASDIKIILADGTEHFANYLLVSENYDLALMSLFSGDYTYLPKPPLGKRLQQGEKVFTVGSPVGLRQTVTSGVFSGYRKRDTDDHLFLQTDAAINPGNSGGPLIDENGFVYGVNTMILRDTEGIGFAIPIEKVFEEFGSALY